MKPILFLTFILVISPLVLSGQSVEERMIMLRDSSVAQLEEGDGVDNSVMKSRHFGWDLAVGSGFTYLRGIGSGMNLYAVPMVTMPLNDRFSVHAGLIASRSYPIGAFYKQENLDPGMFTSLALFAAASYRMNDRLVFHGAGMKQLLSVPVITPFSPLSSDHFSFGATYKLGNNITIGASIHLNNGGNYFAAPGHHAGFYSPYFW